MAKLTITRGLPGSGKTTWAKAQPDVWRVNRDLIRAMFTGVWDYSNQVDESMVTLLQRQMIKELLHKDRDVIVDDTNLNWRDLQSLIKFLKDMRGINIEVHVKEFLHVPVEVCIERDAARPNPVGRDVIMDTYRRYLGE